MLIKKRDLALVLLWLVVLALGTPSVLSNPSHLPFVVATSFVIAVMVWAVGYAIWMGVTKVRGRGGATL